MGEQRKQSLISAQINWEPGVKMSLLKRTFVYNRVAAGAPQSEGEGILSPPMVSLMQ